MNWLAHAFLSTEHEEERLGNFLADLVDRKELAQLSAPFRRGVDRHRRIDAFTDSHPVHTRSRGRIQAPYRRFAGILIDIFYDHFLACAWPTYSSISLEEFARDCYASARAYRPRLSEDVCKTLDRLIAEDWLCSYRNIEGIQKALWRVDRILHWRMGKSFDLEKSIAELTGNYEQIADDFREFFPDLQAAVA